MGDIKPVKTVKYFCGIIARDEATLQLARQELIRVFGPLEMESELIPFTFTDYYTEEMGPVLLRQFVAFHAPTDPRKLAETKIATNLIEDHFTVTHDHKTARTVNLDPGYITPANLILATTKDFAHRICIGDGIYAEVTLNFKKNGCAFFDWTYPDFKSDRYQAFFRELRRKYMEEIKGFAAPAKA